MTNSNVNQTVDWIESYFTFYTNSLDEIRTLLNQSDQLDIIYKNLHPDFNFEDISTFKSQLNFTGFLTISILDLLVISKNILISKFQWERFHQLKLGYLTIYESIATYHRHNEISSLAKTDTKSFELHKSISADLKAFKIAFDYPNAFLDIRNTTIAHVDKDFKSYYDTISKIDGDKYSQAILSFLKIIFKMQELSKYLSDNLILQKDGEVFDLDKLVNDMSEKVKLKLHELKNYR